MTFRRGDKVHILNASNGRYTYDRLIVQDVRPNGEVMAVFESGHGWVQFPAHDFKPGWMA